MLVFLAGLAILLPGLCYQVWLGSSKKDPIEILATIFGMSISIHAVVSLFFHFLNLRLGKIPIIVIDIILLMLTGIGTIQKRKFKFSWQWLISFFSITGLIFWRFWQARNLILPPWVDSLHHSLIVRAILEQGWLPQTLQPYLPGPFYYHFAFHTFTAHFAFLSALPAARAVLLLGQIMNASIGFSVYTYAKSISKDWRFAAIAGLLVSFATMMPAYYLSWGRYTLLTGMILLPLAMAEATRLISNDNPITSDYFSFILFTAGTLLAHYFTALLLATYLVVLALWQMIHHRMDFSNIFPQLVKLTISACIALLITFPWLIRVLRNTGMTATPTFSIPENIQTYFTQPEKWSYVKQILGPSSGLALIPLALLSLIIFFRSPHTRAFATWSLFLFFLSLPWGLRFGSFRHDHFIIILFFPIAILSAFLLNHIVEKIQFISQNKYLVNTFIVLICLFICIWGGLQTKDVINQSTVFIDQADYKALIWINANLPADARFFINTTAWGFGLFRGIDGGAWIMPFTGRWSLVPTIFYPFGRDLIYTSQIKDWSQRASEIKSCTLELDNLIQEARISHIYIHKDKGNLQPEALTTCPGFSTVYDQEGVVIIKVSK